MARQPAPTTSGFGHAVSRAQLQFATDMIHLGLLGRLDGQVVFGKIGAGVLHLLIQPQAVKVVTDIVVMMDVFARTIFCIRPGLALLQALYHCSDTRRFRHSERGHQHRDEIAFYRDPAV